jgi:hypothetical protein
MGVVPESGELCRCGELLSGHPYGDHEPEPVPPSPEDPRSTAVATTDDGPSPADVGFAEPDEPEPDDITVTAEMARIAADLHVPMTPTERDLDRWESTIEPEPISTKAPRPRASHEPAPGARMGA